MAKPRSVAQWNALDAKYRKRLESGGITRAKYVRGDNLQLARRGTAPEKPGRKLSPVQKTRLSKGGQKGRGKTERPFGPITKERHQRDVRNARERAKRYAAKPKTKREAEWKDTEDALFWQQYRELMGI